MVAKKVPVLWSTGGIADALGIRYETIDRVAQEIKLPSLVVVRNKGSECFAMSQADANKLRRELVKRYRSGKRGYAGREEIGERLAKVKVGA